MAGSQTIKQQIVGRAQHELVRGVAQNWDEFKQIHDGNLTKMKSALMTKHGQEYEMFIELALEGEDGLYTHKWDSRKYTVERYDEVIARDPEYKLIPREYRDFVEINRGMLFWDPAAEIFPY